jgi:PAS domain S-box-containing protein
VSTAIHVLIVQGVEADAEFIITELRLAGFAPDWRSVATEAEYVDLLGRGVDVIIADGRSPSFNAESALRLLKERELDIPLIVVSSPIGDDAAVALMKQGAVDYVLKGRLGRLGPAVAQAVDQWRLREAKREAEAAIRESEERHRLIIETVRDAIFIIDLEGRLTFGNRSGEELTGYSLAEFRRRPIASLLSPEAARESAARLAAVQAGDEVSPWFETEVVRKDGTRVWVEAQVATVLRDGTPVGRIGVVRDITERRRSEESLRLLDSAVRHAGESIIITTSELNLPGPQILFVNPAFTKMTGYTAEEVMGRTPRILQGPRTDRAVRRRLREDLAAGRESYGETINYRKDRTPFPVAWHITPVRDEHGGVSHFVAIQRDLTEQKQADEQLAAQREALHQSEKLAALGRLAAGIGHELKNPLSVIDGRLELLELHKNNLEAITRDLGSLRAASGRMKRIMTGLSNYAKPAKAELAVLNVGDLLHGTSELVAFEARRNNVDIVVEVAPHLPRIRVERSQFAQILVNLSMNAIEAMAPQGARLTLRAGVEQDRVRIEVADTGPGMPAETLQKIWQPFYTTKTEGTGLGLSIVRGLVAEQPGGTIDVRSEVGRGTTFTITLPAVQRFER